MRFSGKIFLISAFLLSAVLMAQNQRVRYYEAMDAFEKGDYYRAHELFESYIKGEIPEDDLYSSAKYYSAESLFKLGELSGAISGYEYLVNRLEYTAYRELALLKLGQIYYTEERYALARDRLIRLNKEYPWNDSYGSAAFWIGEAFIYDKFYRDAVEYLKDALNSRRTNQFFTNTIYSLAFAYESLGEIDEAIKFYDEILSFHKESDFYASAQIRIGVCYFKQGDYDLTILELSNPRLNELPLEKQVEAKYLIADSYYRIREFDKAAEMFKQIVIEYPATKFLREIKYALAWCYFQTRQYADAYNSFNSLVSGTDSVSVNSYYWSGESKRYSKDLAGAKIIFDDFIRRYPESPVRYDAEFNLALISFEEKKFDEAERVINDLLTSGDTRIKARCYTLLGELSNARGDYKNGVKHFTDAISISSEYPETDAAAKLGLAISLHFAGEYEKSIKQLDDLVFTHSGYEISKVNYYYGENYFALKNYRNAIDYLITAGNSNSAFQADIQYTKAYAFFNMRDYANSKFAFLDFVNNFPADLRISDAYMRLAESYFAEKNFSAANEIYAKLKNDTAIPNKDYVLYQSALSLFNAGKPYDAIVELRTFLKDYPNSGFMLQARYMIGYINFELGRYLEAVRNYMAVLPDSSKNPEIVPLVLYSVGDSYYNLSEYDSAVVSYRTVIQQYPGTQHAFDALNGLMLSYYALGENEKALASVDEYLELNTVASKADDIFIKKGEFFYGVGEFETAKINYSEFISTFPNSPLLPQAYFWLGKSTQMLGEPDNAVLSFTELFEKFPQSDFAVSAAIEASLILRGDEKYDEAVALLDKASELYKKSARYPEIIFNKAEIFVLKGDQGTAYDLYDEIISFYDANVFSDKARLSKGKIELSAQRYEKAFNLFMEVITRRNDDLAAEAQYYAGLTLFDQEKYTDAITALVRIQSLYAEYDKWTAMSFILLGDTYQKLDDKKKAEEMYKTVIENYEDAKLVEEAQDKLDQMKKIKKPVKKKTDDKAGKTKQPAKKGGKK
ncbi:MAG: tetratricopeptide repeat protein [Ignavibacteriaceae bacterium]|nr:tetratricopeptide repeat protein [Ignavibacteriaceae bacterium]